ncbi:MAG: hypothetical protein ACKV22_25330 [Bryobacteraceae bacterium]
MFPTCLGAAGVPIPKGRDYDGADLGPVLFEGKPGREALHFYYSDTDLRAVRKGPWKMHLETSAPFAGPPGVQKHDPPLLFHLLRDPSEKYNVADGHPEIVMELQEVIARHQRSLKPGVLQR